MWLFEAACREIATAQEVLFKSIFSWRASQRRAGEFGLALEFGEKSKTRQRRSRPDDVDLRKRIDIHGDFNSI